MDNDARFKQIQRDLRAKEEKEEKDAKDAKDAKENSYMGQIQKLGNQVYNSLPSRNQVYNSLPSGKDIAYYSFSPLAHVVGKRVLPSLYNKTGPVADTGSFSEERERDLSSRGLTVGKAFLDQDMSIDYYAPVVITDPTQLSNYHAYLSLFERVNTEFQELIQLRLSDESYRYVDHDQMYLYKFIPEIRKEKQTLLDELGQEFQKLYENGKKIIRLKYFMDQCLGSYKQSGDDMQLMINLATFYRQLSVINDGYYYFTDTLNSFNCLPIEIVVMAVLTSLNNHNGYSIGYYKARYNRGLPLFADWENPDVRYESEDARNEEIEKISKFYEKNRSELKTCTRRHEPTKASLTKTIKFNMQQFIGSFDYYKELLPDQPDQYSRFITHTSHQPQRLMITDTHRQPQQRFMIESDTHRASHTPSTSLTPSTSRTSHTPRSESNTFYNTGLSQDLNDELVKDRKLHGLLRVGVMSGIAKDIIKLILELNPVKNPFGNGSNGRNYLKKYGGKSRKQKQSRKPRKQSRKQKKSKKSRK